MLCPPLFMPFWWLCQRPDWALIHITVPLTACDWRLCKNLLFKEMRDETAKSSLALHLRLHLLRSLTALKLWTSSFTLCPDSQHGQVLHLHGQSYSMATEDIFLCNTCAMHWFLSMAGHAVHAGIHLVWPIWLLLWVPGLAVLGVHAPRLMLPFHCAHHMVIGPHDGKPSIPKDYGLLFLYTWNLRIMVSASPLCNQEVWWLEKYLIIWENIWQWL